VPAGQPGAGTPEEIRLFEELQARLGPLFSRVFPDPNESRSVVVIPSLSLDAAMWSNIPGAHHYEERMLCLLMLLRLPRTHVVYVSSTPIYPSIIDYYMHLLPGVPSGHARARLTLLSCHDSSPRPLTQKILERPRLQERIRKAIPNLRNAHLTCFTVSDLERRLAVRLGIPIYGCDPSLGYLGSKSGSREVFREAGVKMPDGFESLKGAEDLIDALTELKGKHSTLRYAVIKLDEGFAGEGNALFAFEGAPTGARVKEWIRKEIPKRIRFESSGESWESYISKFRETGGVAECLVEGENRRSPSVQLRIDPLGAVSVISTHDQVFAEPGGQSFHGCSFPAAEDYRLEIQQSALKVAEILKNRAVLGRFGVDYVSVQRGRVWEHYAIEINLRKGGTTHPFLMLQFLTDGVYDAETGLYKTPTEQARFYFASDSIKSDLYRGLTPDDLIDIAVLRDLHFDGATQQGVVFHLLGALSEFGKLGALCVGSSPEKALELHRATLKILDQEGQRQSDATANAGKIV
jgi:hypothetical protein